MLYRYPNCPKDMISFSRVVLRPSILLREPQCLVEFQKSVKKPKSDEVWSSTLIR